MNTIQNLFQQAQLAEAAYANLAGMNAATPKTTLELALKTGDGKFSTAQATAFANEWSVVDQYNNSSWLGLGGTGFSATVFQNNATGAYTFAIRGTNFPTPSDLGADLSLASGGVAFDQTLDMVNYLLRLQAGSSGVTRQVELLAGATAPSLTSGFVNGIGSGEPKGSASNIFLRKSHATPPTH